MSISPTTSAPRPVTGFRVLSISPVSADQGQTLDITITGRSFRAGDAASFSGSGITVNSTIYVNRTTLTANITVDWEATAGVRSLTVTRGVVQKTLADCLTVIEVPLTVTSIDPTTAQQGETLDVTIHGTAFAPGAAASFGAGVTVNATTRVSATELTASITVDGSAGGGLRSCTVTLPSAAQATLPDCLTILYVYLLLDQFTTAASAPLASPRECEPGPGQLTIVDVEANTLSIAGGKLAYVAQASAIWGKQTARGAGVTRTAGRTLIGDVTPANTNMITEFGWFQSATPPVTSFAFESGGYYVTVNGEISSIPTTANFPLIGNYTSAEYQLAHVLRATGAFLLIKGGIYTDWTLLFVRNTGTAGTMYPLFTNFTGVGTLDNYRVPAQLWTPTPLVSDAFTRANSSTIGNSAGGGSEESGGTGIAATEVVGDWAISSNTLVTQGDSPGDAGWVVTWAAAQANVLVQAQVTLQTNSVGGIVLGVGDNKWYRVAIDDANNVIRIHEWDGSAYTQRASTAVTINPATAYQLLAARDGQLIRGYVNGGSHVTYDSAAVNQSATAHGLHGATAADAFDNFVIWSRTQTLPGF